MVPVADSVPAHSLMDGLPKVVEAGETVVALVSFGRVILCERADWQARQTQEAVIAAAEQIVLVVPLDTRDCS